MLTPANMPNEIQLSIRVPGDVPERAAKLAEKLATLPAYKAFRLSKATVIRLAAMKGMDELEAEVRKAEAEAKRASRQGGNGNGNGGKEDGR